MNAQRPRSLPQWAWVLAVLFFPSGVFVALGAARLLSWPKAIIGALLSYGCVIGFIRLMVHGEQAGAGGLIRSITLLGGLLVFCLWGWVLHFIGHRAGYWSVANLRAWKLAGWLAVAVMSLAAAGVVLQFVTRSGAV